MTFSRNLSETPFVAGAGGGAARDPDAAAKKRGEIVPRRFVVNKTQAHYALK